MTKFKLLATSSFGLESVVKREIKALGFPVTVVENGKVFFEADASGMADANLWLRCADRVLLVAGIFKARDFDQLFEGTRSLPWDELIPRSGAFPVVGKSVKSRLHSVPACQSVVKKAVVDKLRSRYGSNWFKEDGPLFRIQVSILKDIATLTIDTSGDGLHKRGYRREAVEAPLKETLAAAMIKLSFWHHDRLLVDPFCGSGTIPIEAALIGRNVAPGLRRIFASESWPIIGKHRWAESRARAEEAVLEERALRLRASDIDGQAVEIARKNAVRAGVADGIDFDVQPFEDIPLDESYGVMICNPPYGERIGYRRQIEETYRVMGSLLRHHETWSVYVLTAHERFERLYGRPANRKRKLYNGRIKVDYYQFHGRRPPTRRT